MRFYTSVDDYDCQDQKDGVHQASSFSCCKSELEAILELLRLLLLSCEAFDDSNIAQNFAGLRIRFGKLHLILYRELLIVFDEKEQAKRKRWDRNQQHEC